MRKIKSSLLALVAILLLIAACDQHTVDPAPSAPALQWKGIGEFEGASSPGDIWGSSSHDVYVAYYQFGGRGSVLKHFDGARWSDVAVDPQGRYVESVWGSGPDDVYAAGGRLWHFDGSTWTDVGPYARNVTGTSKDNVFVTRDNSLLHFNGATTDTLLTITRAGFYLRAVWGGDGPSAMAIVEENSPTADDSLMRFSAGVWSRPELAPGLITAFAGPSPDDIIAVGRDDNGSMAWHWDGAQWTPMMSSGQRPTLFDVVEVSGNDIYAGSDRDVLHFDGSTWQSMNPTGSRYFDHVWASASDDVYATGDEVVHYDGSAWKAAIPIEPQSPNSVWADSRGRLVVGGRAVIYRLENGAWSKEGGDSLRDDVDAIDGNAWDDLYAATYYGVYHSTGAVWTLMPSSPGSMTHLSVVPSGEIYASNGYQVFRYDGNTWTKIQEVNVFSGYEALEAVSPNDAFFGYADGILRFNGSSWTRLYDDACGDIWAASPTNIYATGARVVLHSDGGQFTPVGPVVPDGLTAIQGASADYILGVGRNGYVLWKDGRWLTGPNEYPGYIIDLVAGRDGSIVRFDGRQRTGTYLLAYNTE